MSRRLPRQRRWIEPQKFRDLRRDAGMTRMEAAKALDVTARTIQNWETGGARIPWMAYRMLRILCGYALPGAQWEGWTVRGNLLINPAGRTFSVPDLEYLEHVFGMARLWRSERIRTSLNPVDTVIPFPDRRKAPEEAHKPPQAQIQRIGGTR